MDKISSFIAYDRRKITEIGFKDSTVHELIKEFNKYLISFENQYLSTRSSPLHKNDILKMLHKLEGSLQYLALTGPISYIHFIKNSISSDKNDNYSTLIEQLLIITRKTLIQLQADYS